MSDLTCFSRSSKSKSVFELFILQKVMFSVTLRNMNTRRTENVKASQVASWLLAHGKASATTREIAELLGIPDDHVRQRLTPLRSRGEIISPAHGLWVPIPPEYLSWGAPPAIEIINDLMEHFDVSYYIGWLSAAELFGATHHAPQVFQVATSRSLRARTIGRSRMQFLARKHIQSLPIWYYDTRSGKVPVSSRALTMLDIASDLQLVGGIDNAANLIVELSDTSDKFVRDIADIAEGFSVAALRRLGWILENHTDITGLNVLATKTRHRSTQASVLNPTGTRGGCMDETWGLIINKELELDV